MKSVDIDRFDSFNFPDGQPHISVSGCLYDKEITLQARISSSDDLIRLLLAKNALQGVTVHLNILYLMGARMDRAIPDSMKDNVKQRHPFTLRVICDLINNAGFASIKILHPHSEVSTALLNATPVIPMMEISKAISLFGVRSEIVIITPDVGANKLGESVGMAHGLPVVQCLKTRDMATGHLSGFRIADDPEKVRGKLCLMVDDLCDGGGTFAGLGGVLKQAGAAKTGLYVTHGVMSKGWNIANVDHIFTTQSYKLRVGPEAALIPTHVEILEWLTAF